MHRWYIYRHTNYIISIIRPEPVDIKLIKIHVLLQILTWHFTVFYILLLVVIASLSLSLSVTLAANFGLLTLNTQASKTQ